MLPEGATTINYEALKKPFKEYLQKCFLNPSLDKAVYDWVTSYCINK